MPCIHLLNDVVIWLCNEHRSIVSCLKNFKFTCASRGVGSITWGSLALRTFRNKVNFNDCEHDLTQGKRYVLVIGWRERKIKTEHTCPIINLGQITHSLHTDCGGRATDWFYRVLFLAYLMPCNWLSVMCIAKKRESAETFSIWSYPLWIENWNWFSLQKSAPTDKKTIRFGGDNSFYNPL